MVLYFITGIGAVAAIVIAAYYLIEMAQKQYRNTLMVCCFMASKINGLILILTLRFIS